MKAIGYLRVSSEGQDYTRQKKNLESIAEEKGWQLKRVFAEKVSGTTKATTRTAFKELLQYVDEKCISTVLISEISRLGRSVVDILSTIEMLHSKGVSLYVQQFSMHSLIDGKVNPTFKLLSQMLSIGAELENNLRRERQSQGIELAKLNGKFKGRRKGAKANPNDLLRKYEDIVELIKNSDLSLRRISSITGKSINTVRKINQLLAI